MTSRAMFITVVLVQERSIANIPDTFTTTFGQEASCAIPAVRTGRGGVRTHKHQLGHYLLQSSHLFETQQRLENTSDASHTRLRTHFPPINTCCVRNVTSCDFMVVKGTNRQTQTCVP